MLRIRGVTLITLAFAVLSARGSYAQAILPTGFTDQMIVGGLDYPVCMARIADGRVLFTERYSDKVRLLVNDTLVTVAVGMVDSVSHSSERGLIGIAVDPGFPGRPYVYVQYDCTTGPSIRISRFTVTGDLPFSGNGVLTWNPASRYDVIAGLQDSLVQHNGGTLRFGPDGMLYSSLGNDETPCKAVLKTQLIGKILRLDISRLPAGPGVTTDLSLITPADNPFVGDADPHSRLVWEMGLRNPYSFQIDPSGDLYIADVGDTTYEELDLANAPGLDYGYPAYEGPLRTFYHCPEQRTDVTFPIYYYSRVGFQNGAAIITAGVYHRPASGAARFPAQYDGDCFISDAGEGFLRRLKKYGSAWAVAPPVAGQPADSDWAQNMDGVTDYFVAPDGALWYLKHYEFYLSGTGEIHRIIANQSTEAAGEPPRFEFEAPRPVPARGTTTLSWSLPVTLHVTLTIHDVAGREVRRLVDEREEGGRHDRAWDGRDTGGARVAPGVYFAALRAGDHSAIARLVLLR